MRPTHYRIESAFKTIFAAPRCREKSYLRSGLTPDASRQLSQAKHSKICPTNWNRRELPASVPEEILREIRWVLKDAAGMELPPPARKTIDLEGRLVKDAVRKALRERQTGLTEPCPRRSRVQEAGP